MPLFLGSGEKIKISSNGSVFNMNVPEKSWRKPILVGDRVLYVRQVYNATQKNTVLEVK